MADRLDLFRAELFKLTAAATPMIPWNGLEQALQKTIGKNPSYPDAASHKK